METAQYAYRHRGAVRIQNLADDSYLSLRQYERRFAAEIGFTPRLFARMTRFQVTLDAKRMSPGRSWLTIAHQLGYFDQMHMVRDFKKLSGFAPGAIFQQIGDYQPWSLSAPATPYYFPESDDPPRLRG
jgi:AraC-like DNA-binding protein